MTDKAIRIVNSYPRDKMWASNDVASPLPVLSFFSLVHMNAPMNASITAKREASGSRR